MRTSRYDLHVFGVNLSAAPVGERGRMRLSPGEVRKLLRSLATSHPTFEAVVVRARNHVEAYVAAPAGTNAVKPWVAHLKRHRPDLLQPQRRSLHYHLAGQAAESHLARLAAGHFATSSSGYLVSDGIKAALGVAARCGTLGQSLDALFLRALTTDTPYNATLSTP